MRVMLTLMVLFLGVGLMSTSDAISMDTNHSTTDEKSIYDYKLKSITGEEVDLSKYKGKTVLIVNVASRCGYTKQYTDMQAAYEKYKDRGFVILGVPCNQFGAQEPGTEEQIIEFCKTNYGVQFPMFSKIDVKGGNADPLYKYLTALETEPKGAGEVSWNFEKFLVNAEGKVVGRYKSAVSPTSKEMSEILESLLPAAGDKG